ncbi:MAG: Bug family tripartite tricarboxylate transporter substrate binding protein [Burkholderiales bacterium]
MTAQLFATFLALAAASHALGQADFPNRPVRIVVPFPAGGSADAMPRLISARLSEKWGQPVIVENKSGAAGNVGADFVAKAEPDGHTLLASAPGPIAIHQALYKKLSFDPDAFVPVTILSLVPNVLVVHPKVSANTIAELIAFAKANPDKLNYASQGSGGTAHLSAELFKSLAGIRMVHVPYKGAAPAVADLLGGQVDLMFENIAGALPHVRAGKLRLLGVGTEKRMDEVRDVPAISETLPGFVAVAWFGVVAPPKTPAALAARISADMRDALKDPDVIKRMADRSATPVGGTPAETARFIRAETERWSKVIRDAGAQVD